MLNTIIKGIKAKFHKYYCAINPVKAARKSGVRIGENCRLINVDFGSEPYLITLGNHVSATQTSFITHDGAIWCFRDKFPDADLFGRIKIGNNVFLGYGVIVLPGVTIGDNVIVGAGAVVAKDIPSNCVAVGCPAKPIKSLDEYLVSNQARFMPTKGMVPEVKREYLMKFFNIQA